jgi:hypothetical protein
MTDEEEFERVVLARIEKAKKLTGHSFAGLLGLIQDIGAVEAARRLISTSNLGTFQAGMQVLFDADLLELSIEQAVIDFGNDERIFDRFEVQQAAHRLQVMRILFTKLKAR